MIRRYDKHYMTFREAQKKVALPVDRRAGTVDAEYCLRGLALSTISLGVR